MSDPFLNQVALDIRPRGLGTSADYINQSVNASISETSNLAPINSLEFAYLSGGPGIAGHLQGSSSAGNIYIVNSGISGNSMGDMTVEFWYKEQSTPIISHSYYPILYLRSSSSHSSPGNTSLPYIELGYFTDFATGSANNKTMRLTVSGVVTEFASHANPGLFTIRVSANTLTVHEASNNPITYANIANPVAVISVSAAGLAGTPLYSVTLLPTTPSWGRVGRTRVTMASRSLPTTLPLDFSGSGFSIDESVTESFNTTSSYIESPVNRVDEVLNTSIEYKESPVNRVDEVIDTTSGYIEGAVNRVDEVIDTTSGYIEGAVNRVDEYLSTATLYIDGKVINARDYTTSFNNPDPTFGKTAFITDATTSFNNPDPIFGKAAFITDASVSFTSFDGAYAPVPVTKTSYSFTNSTVNYFIEVNYIIPVTTQTYSYVGNLLGRSIPIVVDPQSYSFIGRNATYSIYINHQFDETVIEQLTSSDIFNFEFVESVSESFEITLDSLDDASIVISESFTLSSFGSADSQFVTEIIESIINEDLASNSANILEGFTDTLFVGSATGVFTPEIFINEVINATEIVSEWTNLSGLQETVIESLISTSSAIQTINTLASISELVRILDAGVILYLEELQELLTSSFISIDVQNSLEIIRERFTLHHELYTALSAMHSVDEYLDILADYQIGYQLIIDEYFNTVDSSNNILYVIERPSETVETDLSLGDQSLILIRVVEPLNISEDIDTTAIFNFLVNESFKVIDVGIKKGMVMSSYTYQPETTSVTTYSNYNFTSSARFHKEYLFANEDGLYLYGADTDNGVPITSTITTPAYDFGTSNLKGVSQAYLGLSTDNLIIMKVRVDGKAEVTYKLNKRTTDLQTLQIDIGKGLIGRYFQFEIITQADHFDLESIEFSPLDIGRKR